MEHENHTLKHMEAYFASKEQKAKDAFWRDVRGKEASNAMHRKYKECQENDYRFASAAIAEYHRWYEERERRMKDGTWRLNIKKDSDMTSGE